MTILDTIADHARERVRRDKAAVSCGEMRERALALGPGGGERFLAAVTIGDKPPAPRPLIYARVDKDGIERF